MRRRFATTAGLLAAVLLPGTRGRADAVVSARRAAQADPKAEVGVLRCWPPGAVATNATVSVQAADGRALGFRVVWWAPGEPLSLRFDARGLNDVVVRIRPGAAGQGGDPATAWADRAGVVVETRRRVNDAADTWADVKAQWDAAGPALGRSEVSAVFDGLHRHGPTHSFQSRYEGWFQVPDAGRYGFATISDDASFLWVDGQLVAEWPGWHGLEGGRHGQHHGWLQLNAGVHRIEYHNVQNDGGFQVAAAWRRPGREEFEVMPAEAFVPTVAFEATSVEGDDPGRSAAAFRWWPERHVVGDGGPLVGMRFEAVGAAATGTVFRWTLPDGAVREGRSLSHVFCGASRASVTLDVLRGGQRVGRLSQLVAVRPDWTQRAEFDEALHRRLMEELPDPVLAALSPGALSRWVVWAAAQEDRVLLERLAAVCLKRARTFDASGADALYALGFHYQHPSLRRYADAQTVWKALLARKDAAPALRGRTALHLGGLSLHALGDLRAAESLFAEAEGLLPEGDDRRLLEIYRGDLRVLQGRLDAAREGYLRAGTVVAPDNVHYEVRRVERLERVRRFLAAGEHDAAERVLRELEWECPMERMDLETGLLLTRVQRARGELEFALRSVQRLRAVAAGDPRYAELLWLAAQVLRDSGRTAEAAAAVSELRRLFPYSEEAAQAQMDGSRPAP